MPELIEGQWVNTNTPDGFSLPVGEAYRTIVEFTRPGVVNNKVALKTTICSLDWYFKCVSCNTSNITAYYVVPKR